MLIIKVENGKIEKALKTLKRKTIKTKQNKRLRANKHFSKPSAVKRLEMQKAIYRQNKSNSDSQNT
jgi:small subunit ribosomal protein S21|tara:strand:- start:489 stop:686 length:198 start_codon:yes stop_codon:yes gene_type:complete